MKRYSFWKPDPIPSPKDPILSAGLVPLGEPDDVWLALSSIPGVIPICETPRRLLWARSAGVELAFEEDPGPIAPGEVLTISARSAVLEHFFYRLYVQVFERLGAVVLVEEKGLFLPPRDFKAFL